MQVNKNLCPWNMKDVSLAYPDTPVIPVCWEAEVGGLQVQGPLASAAKPRLKLLKLANETQWV